MSIFNELFYGSEQDKDKGIKSAADLYRYILTRLEIIYSNVIYIIREVIITKDTKKQIISEDRYVKVLCMLTELAERIVDAIDTVHTYLRISKVMENEEGREK